MKKLALILVFLAVSYAQGEVMEMKKAVMIIAKENFRDEELLEPKKILEDAGIEVKVASTVLGEVKGTMGAKVKPDILFNNIKIEDFDAIIFIGGGGSSQYWDDPLAHQLALGAVNNNKVIAAICIAPVTLAKAGILKGKRSTVWASEAAQLKANGANYTGKPIEVDGKIITASGPFAARQFGEELAKAIKE